MKTGEGKILTITAPAYLGALTGQPVHIATANEYLARRDCLSMAGIYTRLGLSCAVVTTQEQFIADHTTTITNPALTAASTSRKGETASDEDSSRQASQLYLRPCTRKEAYQADITYGTLAAFGFDYLRDNLARTPEELVQPGRLYFLILDKMKRHTLLWMRPVLP